jgi:putative ATP-dependent endonuclease of the OLD family
VIATHSPVLLSAFFPANDAHVFSLEKPAERAEPAKLSIDTFWLPPVQSQMRHVNTTSVQRVLDILGVRAGHVLQANCVIWVAGPSDRLYIRRWLDLWSDRGVVEGRDYACVFYGGRLARHLTMADASDDLLHLARINRRAIVVMDSDRRGPTAPIGTTKLRLQDEVTRAGGDAWITAGREIENYLSLPVLRRIGFHASAAWGPYVDVPQEMGGTRTDKLDLARRAAEATTFDDLDVLDLIERIDAICGLIRRWSGAPRTST